MSHDSTSSGVGRLRRVIEEAARGISTRGRPNLARFTVL
jgi:hypothetical protein